MKRDAGESCERLVYIIVARYLRMAFAARHCHVPADQFETGLVVIEAGCRFPARERMTIFAGC
jgi:hypothetical protein